MFVPPRDPPPREPPLPPNPPRDPPLGAPKPEIERTIAIRNSFLTDYFMFLFKQMNFDKK